MTDTTSTTQTRAYFLWDVAGRPEGRDDEFWSEAEREIEAEQLVVDEIAVGKPAPPKSKPVKARKPTVAKATVAGTAPVALTPHRLP